MRRLDFYIRQGAKHGKGKWVAVTGDDRIVFSSSLAKMFEKFKREFYGFRGEATDFHLRVEIREVNDELRRK